MESIKFNKIRGFNPIDYKWSFFRYLGDSSISDVAYTERLHFKTTTGDEEKNRLTDDFHLVDSKLDRWQIEELIDKKSYFIAYVDNWFNKKGEKFDRFNGLAPTRYNAFHAYEFGALWLWSFLIALMDDYSKGRAVERLNDNGFYKKFADLISKVFKKYPVTTSSILFEVNLHYPDSQFMDYTNMDDANFDGDNQEGWDNEKADEFNRWILHWTNRATDKDKMRVAHWFETKKSHKQIFSEIQKVVGNPSKFNCRLALFMERLLNNQNLDYFYEKSGFENKEDLYMAYLDKLEMFDDEAKHSFIKKYLLKGE